MTGKQALVVADKVVKRYGPDTVLDNVSLSVASGQQGCAASARARGEQNLPLWRSAGL